MSPAVWKEMFRHPCPDDYLDEADCSTRSAIRAWQAKRKHLIAERIRQELEARFEEHAFDDTPSKPFIKLLIQDTASSSDFKSQALLTVWAPSSEQLELLQEGSAVRGRQLSCKSMFDGLLQISANGRTVLLPGPAKLNGDQEKSIAQNSAACGVFRAFLLSKRLRQVKTGNVQINLVGTILTTHMLDGGACWHSYLTDRSGMVVRVISRDPLQQQQLPSFVSVLLPSVEVEPFDWNENVGVATISHPSVVRESDMSSPALQRLSRWLGTSRGREKVLCTLANLNARLPWKPKMRLQSSIFFAYVIDFVVLECKHLILTIDCGQGDPLKLELPFDLLDKINVDLPWAVFGPSEEKKALKLSRMGSIFRARSLHQIVVREISDQVQRQMICNQQIVDLRVPSIQGLSSWYVNVLKRANEVVHSPR